MFIQVFFEQKLLTLESLGRSTVATAVAGNNGHAAASQDKGCQGDDTIHTLQRAPPTALAAGHIVLEAANVRAAVATNRPPTITALAAHPQALVSFSADPLISNVIFSRQLEGDGREWYTVRVVAAHYSARPLGGRQRFVGRQRHWEQLHSVGIEQPDLWVSREIGVRADVEPQHLDDAECHTVSEEQVGAVSPGKADTPEPMRELDDGVEGRVFSLSKLRQCVAE